MIRAFDKPRSLPDDEMMKSTSYTALIEKEDDDYTSLCHELDVASQGSTIEEALDNLREAVELFLKCASPDEVRRRTHSPLLITRFEAAHA